jgi:hypothetical protein
MLIGCGWVLFACTHGAVACWPCAGWCGSFGGRCYCLHSRMSCWVAFASALLCLTVDCCYSCARLCHRQCPNDLRLVSAWLVACMLLDMCTHGYVQFTVHELGRPPNDVQLLFAGLLRVLQLAQQRAWDLQRSNVCCTSRVHAVGFHNAASQLWLVVLLPHIQHGRFGYIHRTMYVLLLTSRHRLFSLHAA